MTTLPIISTLLSPIIQKTEYQGLTNIHFPLKESPRWFKRNGGLFKRNDPFLLKEQGRSFFIHSINKSGLFICKNKQNSKAALLYVHYNRFQLISIRSTSIQQFISTCHRMHGISRLIKPFETLMCKRNSY